MDSERYLASFHDANPGITPRAFACLPVRCAGRCYASSYECLASEVPQSAAAQRVLDLACGDGFLLELLASREQAHLSLTGVDMSGSELGAARARLGAAAVLVQGRAQSLPLAVASQEQVVCHMALMLMDDVGRVLAEVRRVLAPGGRLSAIVGGKPPPSPGFAAYVELLSHYPREEQFAGLRFGDRRLLTAEGIEGVLSEVFEAVSVAELEVRRRYTPRELCEWFEDTYEFHMLNPEDRQALRADFIARLEPHCDSDGKIEYADRLYLATATVA